MPDETAKRLVYLKCIEIEAPQVAAMQSTGAIRSDIAQYELRISEHSSAVKLWDIAHFGKLLDEGEVNMVTFYLRGRLFASLGKLLNGRHVRWMQSNSVIGYLAYLFLSSPICFGVAPAQADMLPSLAWNCWAGGQNPAQINCIHKRGQLPKIAPDPDNELEVQLLDQLQEKKLNGKAAKLEGVEWRNIDILHEGTKWTIQLHSYPRGKLLEEKRLNKLVKAVLCPSSTPCTVTFRNATQRKTEGAK